MFLRGGLRSSTAKRENCASLLSANQVVRALPPNKVPLREIYPEGQSSDEMRSEKIHFLFKKGCVNTCFFVRVDVTPPMTAAYLEVTDLNSKKVKYIPVPR